MDTNEITNLARTVMQELGTLQTRSGGDTRELVAAFAHFSDGITKMLRQQETQISALQQELAAQKK